jgi:hypothetical protein
MSSRFKDILPLKAFMRRQQVLSLYRRLLRACRLAEFSSGGGTGGDLHVQVKREFNIHSNIQDWGIVSSLLVEGTRQADLLESLSRHSYDQTQSEQTQMQVAGDDVRNGNWLGSGDDDDIRGRVGVEWPWEQTGETNENDSNCDDVNSSEIHKS